MPGPSHFWAVGKLKGPIELGYQPPVKAASTAFKLAPTNNRPPKRTKGRRTNRGSLSINSSISCSDKSLSASPIFFRLGLRRAKTWEIPGPSANSRISVSVKGSLK